MGLRRRKLWTIGGRENGGTVASGVSRDDDVNSGRLLPLRSMANFQRHTFSMDSSLPHFRRLRLLPVLLINPSIAPPFNLCSVQLGFLWSCALWCVCRRFVGVVFGSKGTDVILSVEYFCCDRPNPILQVSFFFFVLFYFYSRSRRIHSCRIFIGIVVNSTAKSLYYSCSWFWSLELVIGLIRIRRFVFVIATSCYEGLEWFLLLNFRY